MNLTKDQQLTKLRSRVRGLCKDNRELISRNRQLCKERDKAEYWNERYEEQLRGADQ